MAECLACVGERTEGSVHRTTRLFGGQRLFLLRTLHGLVAFLQVGNLLGANVLASQCLLETLALGRRALPSLALLVLERDEILQHLQAFGPCFFRRNVSSLKLLRQCIQKRNSRVDRTANFGVQRVDSFLVYRFRSFDLGGRSGSATSTLGGSFCQCRLLCSLSNWSCCSNLSSRNQSSWFSDSSSGGGGHSSGLSSHCNACSICSTDRSLNTCLSCRKVVRILFLLRLGYCTLPCNGRFNASIHELLRDLFNASLRRCNTGASSDLL